MKKIDSVGSLTELVERYSNKGTITNNYLLLDAYIQYINDGQLFCIEKQSNMFILLEKKEFYQLYYHINDLKELIDLNIHKPVTMEILYRGEAQKPESILSYWECCGFKQHLIRDNMMASYNQLILPSEKVSDIEVKIADTDIEGRFTKNLITKTFDKYTGDILTDEEIDFFVNNKAIICAYWKGNLSGILQFETKNNIVWIGHVAIAHEYRGRGIAKELVKAYILYNAKDSKTRYQLWVMQDNIRATNLYHKFGFIYGNKSSASMLKN